MKTLYFIRHAKSSWANIGQKDFDRTLNERGIKDAGEMAQKLFSKNIVIDGFVTSTAVRAHTTCKAFASAYGKKESEIVLVDKLYHAQPHIFYEVINSLDNDKSHVAIFAHNPGITEMVSTQTRPMQLIDMPTCGIVAVTANIDTWDVYETAEKTILFFTYPKEI
jgi:phosphohistidine phosphatase